MGLFRLAGCPLQCMFMCRDRAVPFALPVVCARLCYWLIESVFCATALPRRLVLAHTHTAAGQMRIHSAICPGETLPHPPLVPLPLCPSLSFHLIFIPWCSHLSLLWPSHTLSSTHILDSPFPFLRVLIHLFSYHLFPSLLLLSLCHLPFSIMSKSMGSVFVLGSGGVRAVVLKCYRIPTADITNVRQDPWGLTPKVTPGR